MISWPGLHWGVCSWGSLSGQALQVHSREQGWRNQRLRCQEQIIRRKVVEVEATGTMGLATPKPPLERCRKYLRTGSWQEAHSMNNRMWTWLNGLWSIQRPWRTRDTKDMENIYLFAELPIGVSSRKLYNLKRELERTIAEWSSWRSQGPPWNVAVLLGTPELPRPVISEARVSCDPVCSLNSREGCWAVLPPEVLEQWPSGTVPWPRVWRAPAYLRGITLPHLLLLLCQTLLFLVKRFGLQNHFFQFEGGVAIQPAFLQERPVGSVLCFWVILQGRQAENQEDHLVLMALSKNKELWFLLCFR